MKDLISVLTIVVATVILCALAILMLEKVNLPAKVPEDTNPAHKVEQVGNLVRTVDMETRTVCYTRPGMSGIWCFHFDPQPLSLDEADKVMLQ